MASILQVAWKGGLVSKLVQGSSPEITSGLSLGQA